MKLTAEYIKKHGSPIRGGVLAEGEVTGHLHQLETTEGTERYELEGREYLLVNAEGGVSINHQEHGRMTIPAGVYEKRIDREYDYSAAKVRQVAD